VRGIGGGLEIEQGGGKLHPYILAPLVYEIGMGGMRVG